METANFGKCNKEDLEKNFLEASEDENFKLLTGKTGLDDEILMKYTSSLQESVNELKHCKNCPGLLDCKNKIRGYVYYPNKMGEHLKFSYIACKYEKRRIEYEKESSYCQFFDMPLSLKNASMRQIEVDDAKRVSAIKWLKNFYDTYEENKHQKGLYLHGSFGSGKTFLICAMLNELSKKHVKITISYYPELLRTLKEAFQTDYAEKIKRIKTADILFLDDIGAESVTEWGRDEILGTILQYRMEANLPTFFTSNLTINELEVHLSSTKSSVERVKARRIIERIKQVSDTIELVSKNRRN